MLFSWSLSRTYLHAKSPYLHKALICYLIRLDDSTVCSHGRLRTRSLQVVLLTLADRSVLVLALEFAYLAGRCDSSEVFARFLLVDCPVQQKVFILPRRTPQVPDRSRILITMLSRYVSRSLHGRQYASVAPSLYRGFASSSARMRESPVLLLAW